MAVMLRKSLVLKIERAQTNKTLMTSKHNFNAHFGVFWSNFNKIVFFFCSIYSFRKKHGLVCFRDVFFHWCMSLAIHRNFRNWHQLFCNRSGWIKIHTLPIHIILVNLFHGNIDYLKKHIQPSLIFSQQLVKFSRR